jgi:hypothetical protein
MCIHIYVCCIDIYISIYVCVYIWRVRERERYCLLRDLYIFVLKCSNDTMNRYVTVVETNIKYLCTLFSIALSRDSFTASEWFCVCECGMGVGVCPKLFISWNWKKKTNCLFADFQQFCRTCHLVVYFK